MGEKKLCAEGRRRQEVPRKGAEGVEVARAARARAGPVEAIHEPTEGLVTGGAGEPGAEEVVVEVLPRRDGGERGKAVAARRGSVSGSVGDAAVAERAEHPAPQSRVSCHARQHAEERDRGRGGLGRGGGAGVVVARDDGAGEWSRGAARAELKRRRGRQEAVGAVRRWCVQVPPQAGAQTRPTRRGRGERVDGWAQRSEEARQPWVEVGDGPRGWIICLGGGWGGPQIGEAGGLAVASILRRIPSPLPRLVRAGSAWARGTGGKDPRVQLGLLVARPTDARAVRSRAAADADEGKARCRGCGEPAGSAGRRARSHRARVARRRRRPQRGRRRCVSGHAARRGGVAEGSGVRRTGRSGSRFG